jgi:hypothetical protein
VTTSSRTELSTAVTIAGLGEIRVDAHTGGKAGATAPFLENIRGVFGFGADQFSADRGKGEFGAGAEAELRERARALVVGVDECLVFTGLMPMNKAALQVQDEDPRYDATQEFGIVIESGCLETGLTRELPRKGIRCNCLELCACVTP